MEIGELVTVVIPDSAEEAKCPFSHKPPDPKEKNELGGIGTTLGDNMTAGIGISHESKSDGPLRKGTKEGDPRKRPKKRRLVSVLIKVNGEYAKLSEDGDPLPYPLTCAAHHLVPAQESLKGHEILKYMCKKGEQQDFRNGKSAAPAAVSGSKVWGNVAYNVNGSHNGVWLPGNYAVGGGKVGVQVWSDKVTARRNNAKANQSWVDALDLSPDAWDSGDDDDEEEASEALKRALGRAKKKAFMLAGKNHSVAAGNPKWAYVKAAMDASGGQFHDRHEDYSNEVQDYLRKMAAAYKKMHSGAIKNCKQCEKAARPSGMSKNEVGPPYGIVGRLKNASDFFKGYLTRTNKTLGTRKGRKIVTAANIYTSGWVHAWFNDHTP
ncbi:hypothetical protein HNQ60_000798 [Povalibacter uvarum]|uniref:Uncharacterized protein n=1 Tax=Povalibacter uvarum TaxID=732238 RepID=A0A841HIF2_9GAMM|nr:hypothetical protein [Povalibacter uvarum]MBB6091952.1 hypothetical protein [Povalibacter uvarum]